MRFCFPHNPSSGGPGSFQLRFQNILINLGYTILPSGSWQKSDIIFVVGGTKKVFWLIYHKISGSKIIHRIDGLNTNYNIKIDGFFGLVLKLLRNLNVIIIANCFADKIIFQSEYIESYWKKLIRSKKIEKTTILNGVDLEDFNPKKFSGIKTGEIICVEGSINSYYAISILNSIRTHSVTVVGKIPQKLINLITNPKISFIGRVPRSSIPELLNQHLLYLCLEIEPPCPNSVIEALSMDVPVVGFNTGSLKELVGEAGVIVELELDLNTGCPNKESLNLINDAVDNSVAKNFSGIPRMRAEKIFDISKIARSYLKFILGDQ